MASERKVLKMIVNFVTQSNDFISVKKDFEYFYEVNLNKILNSNLAIREKIHMIYKEIHTFKGNFGISFSVHGVMKAQMKKRHLSVIQ